MTTRARTKGRLLRPARRALLAIVVVSAMGVSAVAADVRPETAKLMASDGEASDRFGSAVAIDKSTILVSAPENDRRGAVYVFSSTGSGWAETARLMPGGVAEGDLFGSAVALDGQTAVIGSMRDELKGSVYVFTSTASGFSQSAKLTAEGGVEGDGFGWSVDLDGDMLVVGAPGTRADRGSVYVFERAGSGFGYLETLTQDESDSGDFFGVSVSLDEGVLAVGAPGRDDNGPNSGAIYVYRSTGSGFVDATKLTAGDGAAYEDFGFSVATDGSRIVGGAYDDLETAGSAYLFESVGSTFVETAKLTASDSKPYEFFGYSVAIDAGRIAIGAAGIYGGPTDGAVYLYEPVGPGIVVEVAKLTASDGTAWGMQLGHSVAMSWPTVVAGAARDDVAGPYTGSAYIFGSRDSDGDGVVDDHDVCPDTLLPDEPTVRLLKKNRYRATHDGFAGADGVIRYTLLDTRGCSATQIIAEADLGRGHTKFGISKGALTAWIARSP